MILGALVVVVVGALIVNYFRGVNQTEETQVETEITSEEVVLVEEEGQLFPAELPATHKVAENENLWTIAEKRYSSGYNWVDIAKANNLTNPDQIVVGQELKLPKAAVIKVEDPAAEVASGPSITSGSYTVAEGDHLWGIAVRAYGDGYKWSEIAHENNLTNPNIIHPGNVLKLPR
jgi:nucleoid-associated protein YgaU